VIRTWVKHFAHPDFIDERISTLERGDVRESRAGNVRERLLSEERLVGRHEDVRECEQSRQHIVLQKLV
jgi:hypothetical protein